MSYLIFEFRSGILISAPYGSVNFIESAVDYAFVGSSESSKSCGVTVSVQTVEVRNLSKAVNRVLNCAAVHYILPDAGLKVEYGSEDSAVLKLVEHIKNSVAVAEIVVFELVASDFCGFLIVLSSKNTLRPRSKARGIRGAVTKHKRVDFGGVIIFIALRILGERYTEHFVFLPIIALEIRLEFVLDSIGKSCVKQRVAGYPVHNVLAPAVKLVAWIAVVFLVQRVDNGIHGSFDIGVVKIGFKFSVFNADKGNAGGAYDSVRHLPAVYTELVVIGITELVAHFEERGPIPVVRFVKLIGIVEAVFGDNALSVPNKLVKTHNGNGTVVFAAPLEHFHNVSRGIPCGIAEIDVLVNRLKQIFLCGVGVVYNLKLEYIRRLTAYHHFAKLVVSRLIVNLDVIKNIVGVVAV